MKRILTLSLLTFTVIFYAQSQNLSNAQINARALELLIEQSQDANNLEKLHPENQDEGRGLKKKLISAISEQLDLLTGTWTTTQTLFDYDAYWNNELRTTLVFNTVTSRITKRNEYKQNNLLEPH